MEFSLNSVDQWKLQPTSLCRIIRDNTYFILSLQLSTYMWASQVQPEPDSEWFIGLFVLVV